MTNDANPWDVGGLSPRFLILEILPVEPEVRAGAGEGKGSGPVRATG